MKTIAAAVAGLVVGIAVTFAYRALLVPSAPSPPTVKGPCASGNPNDRCIDVPIIMVGGQPVIQNIPDETMPKEGEVFWTIRGPVSGYGFQGGGIDFVNIGPSKPPQPTTPPFNNCMPVGSAPATTFKCHNTHQSNGTFGYKVTVTNGAGTALTLDPFIIN
ncbi:MAG TPA: hypothetical protein VF420_08835 [Casimicrobiaceae bacterium]